MSPIPTSTHSKRCAIYTRKSTDARLNLSQREFCQADPGLQQTMRDPFLAPLHKDSRFAAVLKRLDFPIIDPT